MALGYCLRSGQTRYFSVQIDSRSKMIYIHIPRTGGSWFTYQWDSHTNHGDCIQRSGWLRNTKNNKQTKIGRHGTLSGTLAKLDEIKYKYSDHKIITLVRHPIDRILSSWHWFSSVKDTAKKHGWQSIEDMIDEYQAGTIRVNYLPQTNWLNEKGAKFDHIFRFEDLLERHSGKKMIQEHFPLFCKHRTNGSWLSRKGKNKDGKDKVWFKILNKKQIDRIREVYKEDIEYLKEYYEDL